MIHPDNVRLVCLLRLAHSLVLIRTCRHSMIESYPRNGGQYTLQVYGDPEEHPQRESYWGHVNPIGPRACYDEGKRVAETMMYAYSKQVGSTKHALFVCTRIPRLVVSLQLLHRSPHL